MPKPAKPRVILEPLFPGSRTPEEFRAAVRAVMTNRDAKTLTGSPVGAKLNLVKKRVLMAPAVRSPKLEAIRAAVEEVAAERERLAAAKKVSGKKSISGAAGKRNRTTAGRSSPRRPAKRGG